MVHVYKKCYNFVFISKILQITDHMLLTISYSESKYQITLYSGWGHVSTMTFEFQHILFTLYSYEQN